MVGGREHVDVRQVVGHGERADQLRPVDEDDRAHGTGDGADRGDVRVMTGGALDPAEGDQPGAGVHMLGDDVGLHPAVPEGHLTYVVPAVGELAPREVVGAVLAGADDDVLAGRRRELGADEPGGGGQGGDQRDVGDVGPHHARRR